MKTGRIPSLALVLCFSVGSAFAAGAGDMPCAPTTPRVHNVSPAMSPTPPLVNPVTAPLLPTIQAPVQTPSFNPAMTNPTILPTDQTQRLNTILFDANNAPLSGDRMKTGSAKTPNTGSLGGNSVFDNVQVYSDSPSQKTQTNNPNTVNPWLQPKYASQYNDLIESFTNKALGDKLVNSQKRLDELSARINAIENDRDPGFLEYKKSLLPILETIKSLQAQAEVRISQCKDTGEAHQVERELGLAVEKLNNEWKEKVEAYKKPIYSEHEQLWYEVRSLKTQITDDYYAAITKAQQKITEIALADAGKGGKTAPPPEKQPPPKVGTKKDSPVGPRHGPQGLRMNPKELSAFHDAIKDMMSKFYGRADGKYYGPDPAFAEKLVELLRSYPGIDFSKPEKLPLMTKFLPNDYFWDEFGGNTTASDMRAKHSDNPYVTLTADFEQALRTKIINSDGNLTPSDVMKMALQQTGGNYALAVLAAHNLLKDTAKTGRLDSEKLQGLVDRNIFDIEDADDAVVYNRLITNSSLADKLINMRNGPGDKMGVWYHAFAVLSMQVVTDDPKMAETYVAGEAFLRTGSSVAKSIKRDGTNESESPVDALKRDSDMRFAYANYDIWSQAHPIRSVLSVLDPTKPIGKGIAAPEGIGRIFTDAYFVYDVVNGTWTDYGPKQKPATQPVVKPPAVEPHDVQPSGSNELPGAPN